MYTMQRFLVVMIGAALASAAGAQSLPYQAPPGDASNAPTNAGQTQVDPPARVARLGYLSGNVSFTPAGENDWVQAQLNRPVVTGDKLWTDAGGRRAADRRSDGTAQRKLELRLSQPRRSARPDGGDARRVGSRRATPERQ